MFIDLWISEDSEVSARNSFMPSLETLQTFLTKSKQTVVEAQVDAEDCTLLIISRVESGGSLENQLKKNLDDTRPALYMVPISADWDNKDIANAIQQRENSYSQKCPFAIIFFDREAEEKGFLDQWDATKTAPSKKPATDKRSIGDVFAMSLYYFFLSPAFWLTVTALLVGVPTFINSINPTFIDLSQIPALSVFALISGITICMTMAVSGFLQLHNQVWAPSAWLRQLRHWIIDHKMAAFFCGVGFVGTLAAIIAVSVIGIEAPFFEVSLKILTEMFEGNSSLETIESFAEIIFMLAPLALGFLAKNVVLFSETISQNETLKEPMEVALDQGGNGFSIRYRDENTWNHHLFKDQEFSDVLISDRVPKNTTVNLKTPFSSVLIYEGPLGENWGKQVQATQDYDEIKGAFRCILKSGTSN